MGTPRSIDAGMAVGRTPSRPQPTPGRRGGRSQGSPDARGPGPVIGPGPVRPGGVGAPDAGGGGGIRTHGGLITHTRFRVVLLWPLGHATAENSTGGGSRGGNRARTLGPVPVGPHPLPWPDDPRLDPDLLAHGDARNVVDAYRYWTVEAIVADLDTRRSPLHVAIENIEHDLNIGSIVRTANAFNVAGVHVVGRRRWNRRGAMVTDAYLSITHHPDPADLAALGAGGAACRSWPSTWCPGPSRSTSTRCPRGVRAAVRPGGARAQPAGPGRRRRGPVASASTAPPGRSTWPPPRPSRCTAGPATHLGRASHAAG